MAADGPTRHVVSLTLEQLRAVFSDVAGVADLRPRELLHRIHHGEARLVDGGGDIHGLVQAELEAALVLAGALVRACEIEGEPICPDAPGWCPL